MAALTPHALEQLAAAGLTGQQWARANYMRNDWSGDECGCPDDRCANGFHHMGADDCGCLPAMLGDWLAGDPYRFFAIKPPGPVCRLRRIRGYMSQNGHDYTVKPAEDRLTPRQRRRTRHKFNRTWF